MVFGEHWYITLGQGILAIGIITILTITLSTHLINKREVEGSKTVYNSILDRIETIENKIKDLHNLHKDVDHMPKDEKKKTKPKD